MMNDQLHDPRLRNRRFRRAFLYHWPCLWLPVRHKNRNLLNPFVELLGRQKKSTLYVSVQKLPLAFLCHWLCLWLRPYLAEFPFGELLSCEKKFLVRAIWSDYGCCPRFNNPYNKDRACPFVRGVLTERRSARRFSLWKLLRSPHVLDYQGSPIKLCVCSASSYDYSKALSTTMRTTPRLFRTYESEERGDLSDYQ